jgi:hypothetical protein
MVPRTYQIRQVEESDRAKWEGWAQAEAERGDFEAAQGHRDFLRQWEQDHGQEKEELVRPICERRWLKPTARGTARLHTRWYIHQPSWDSVRDLGRHLQALQAELDLELDLLEAAHDDNLG